MSSKTTDLIHYQYTDNVVTDVRFIVETAQRNAYHVVNNILVIRNWMLGQRIALEELKGENRAEYGTKIINELAKELTAEFGKGFTQRSLYDYLLFYKSFPEILHSLSAKSADLHSFSATNLKYMKYFYELFPEIPNHPQLVDKSSDKITQQMENQLNILNRQQTVDDL